MNLLNILEAEDQLLMSEIAVDNLEAWAELVKRYSNLVYSIAFQILKNKSDTEDAVQDTFISLKVYANKFDSAFELRPWLSRVAANQAIQIYKRRKMNNNKESNWMKKKSTAEESQKLDVAEISERKEAAIMVRKAMDTLPEVSRVVLTLYFGSGMNQTEIANELGLSQFSISEKIKQGLEKVKRYLKNSGVHASIALTPSFLQESIVNSAAPSDLLVKLASHIPNSAEKIARVSNKLAVVGGKSKVGLYWILTSIAVSLLAIFGIMYFDDKAEIVPASKVDPKVSPAVVKAPENNKKMFLPIDLSEKILFDINMSDPNSDAIAIYSEYKVDRWAYDEKNKKIVRDFHQNGVVDGFLIPKVFNKASLIRGYVKLNSEKTDLCFYLNTYKDKESATNKNEFKSYIGNIFGGRMLKFYLLPQQELEFKIYVWPNQNKWEALGLIYQNQKRVSNQDYYCWQTFTHQEFTMGLFSDGNLELRNLEFCELSPEWSALTEPDLKETMKALEVSSLLAK